MWEQFGLEFINEKKFIHIWGRKIKKSPYKTQHVSPIPAKSWQFGFLVMRFKLATREKHTQA